MIEGAAGRHQARLSDLAVVVVGSAYVLDVARRSRGAWPGVWPGLEYAPGLVALTLAVALGLVVAIRGFRQFRSREVGVVGATWRLLALAWLAWSAVEVASALQVRPDSFDQLIPREQAHTRLRLFPMMLTLGLIGLMLAVAPLRLRGVEPGARPRVGAWPSVVLAALAGLVLLASHGLFPYLVLIAIDAVWNAMRNAPLVARPMLFTRLARASLETLPGLLGCAATASWIVDDLRESVRDPVAARAARSTVGVVARVATVVLAVGGSAYVWLVSLPRLHPNLTEGAEIVLDRSTTLIVVLGFAALAGGLAARSAARLAIGYAEVVARPSRPFGPWPRRVFGALVGLASAEIIAAAVQSLQGGVEDRWSVPFSLNDWSKLILVPAGWLGYPGTSAGWDTIVERPGDFLFLAASCWLAIHLVWLLVSGGSGRPAAVDALARDRLALGRFLGWWLGLTAAILASLPLFALAALALTHYAVHWFRK